MFSWYAPAIPSLLSGILLLQAASAQGPQPGNKAPAPTSSQPAAPVLVELFTSEGCSTCPPADHILQRLDEYQPIEGAQLIVLSEHVTYWDQLGWKDPNSSTVFTDRQSSYESKLGVKDAYTPQFVIDGSQSASLENVQELEDALNKAKAKPKLAIRIGELTVDPADPTTLRTHIETDAESEKHNADVYVALALSHVESQVLKGENGGKHLIHIAVVQQLTRVGKLSKGKPFAQEVQFKLKPGEDLKTVRLIAFAQESGPGNVLGAALRKPSQ